MDELDNAVDGSAFYELLKNEAQVRVLDVFLTRGSLSATPDRIADLAGVAPQRAAAICEQLEAIEYLQTVGGTSDEYQLNENHESVEALRGAHLQMMDDTGAVRDRFQG